MEIATLQSLVKKRQTSQCFIAAVNELCSMNLNLGSEINTTAESIEHAPPAPNMANLPPVVQSLKNTLTLKGE